MPRKHPPECVHQKIFEAHAVTHPKQLKPSRAYKEQIEEKMEEADAAGEQVKIYGHPDDVAIAGDIDVLRDDIGMTVYTPGSRSCKASVGSTKKFSGQWDSVFGTKHQNN